MVIGSATHTAILEPELFDATYMVVDARDRRSAIYKDAAKAYGDDFTLTRTEHDSIVLMQQSVQANARAVETLKDATKEVSLFVKDPETGVDVRVRFDALGKTLIADLKKTSRDARPEEFSKAIFNYRYHVQAALYMDAYEWHTGEQLQEFRFIVVEPDVPCPVMVYAMDDYSLHIGRETYRKELRQYAKCLEADIWPSYEGSDEIGVISLPEWALQRYEAETETDIIVEG